MKSLDSWAGQRQVLYPDPILGQGGYLFIPDQEVGYDDVGGGGGCGSTIPFARRRDRHRAIDANGKPGKQQGPLAPVIGCQPRRTGNVWIVCRSRFLSLLPGMSATGHGGGSMQPPAAQPSSPAAPSQRGTAGARRGSSLASLGLFSVGFPSDAKFCFSAPAQPMG